MLMRKTACSPNHLSLGSKPVALRMIPASDGGADTGPVCKRDAAMPFGGEEACSARPASGQLHSQGIFSMSGLAKSRMTHATMRPQKKRKLNASRALRIIISREKPVTAWQAQ
jgi:hypothetical protein